MVNLWNKWKFNFPTGQANRIQLKQVFKEVILSFKFGNVITRVGPPMELFYMGLDIDSSYHI